METKIDAMERVIRAAATLTGRSVDELWSLWHDLEPAHGYDPTRTMIDFLLLAFQARELRRGK